MQATGLRQCPLLTRKAFSGEYRRWARGLQYELHGQWQSAADTLAAGRSISGLVAELGSSSAILAGEREEHQGVSPTWLLVGHSFDSDTGIADPRSDASTGQTCVRPLRGDQPSHTHVRTSIAAALPCSMLHPALEQHQPL